MRPWVPVFLSFKAVALALALAHHPVAAVVVFLAPDPWVFLQFVLPSQQAFGPAATSFRTSRKEVWLTIDDGPDPASTPAILELLRGHGARATFFVVGRQVEKHPELARRIAGDGHALANHSHTHPAGTFWSAPPGRTAREIDLCVGALLLSGAPFERYFRPPVGIRNYFLQPQLAARGIDLVLWNARGLDGAGGDPRAALRRVARHIRPGAIVLAHEAGPRAQGRVEFVGMLLEHLAGEGYSCVIPDRGSLVFGRS
ncbi:MAG TPA: polysaccharide deacetylase family protein [Opitutaceae bacterium]